MLGLQGLVSRSASPTALLLWRLLATWQRTGKCSADRLPGDVQLMRVGEDQSTSWVIRSIWPRWCSASYSSSSRWLTRHSRTGNETGADGTTDWQRETRLCLVFIILISDTPYSGHVQGYCTQLRAFLIYPVGFSSPPTAIYWFPSAYYSVLLVLTPILRDPVAREGGSTRELP